MADVEARSFPSTIEMYLFKCVVCTWIQNSVHVLYTQAHKPAKAPVIQWRTGYIFVCVFDLLSPGSQRPLLLASGLSIPCARIIIIE